MEQLEDKQHSLDTNTRSLHLEITKLLEQDRQRKEDIDVLFQGVISIAEQCRVDEQNKRANFFESQKDKLTTCLNSYNKVKDQLLQVDYQMHNLAALSTIEFLKEFKQRD